MAKNIFKRLKEKTDRLKEKTDTMATYLPFESVYYEKTADFYRIAKYAVIVFLFVFIIVAGIACRKDLRAENFRYLFKYVDINPVSTTSSYRDIYYFSDSDTVFALYKNDLAVIGDGKIDLYNIAGKNIMTVKTEGDKLLCDGTGKYLISYYPGTGHISLYNSFSKLYEINLDYPVMYVSGGEGGGFAVITRDGEYASAVYVYNGSFRSVYSWKSNEKYAFSCALSPNGRKVAILSYSSNGGNFSRELSVRNVSNDNTELLVSSEGGFPLDVGFFSDSSLYVLYSDGLEIYDSKLSSVCKESFKNDVMTYSVSENGIAVMTGKTLSNVEISLYCREGHKKFTENFPYTVLDSSVYNDRIYLLCDGAVYIISEEETVSAEIAKECRAMFVFDDGNVLLCYNDHTALLKLSDFN